MLAVLESATEDLQKFVNARDRMVKLLFSQAEEWFSKRILIHSLLSNTSVRFYGFNLIICVRTAPVERGAS